MVPVALGGASNPARRRAGEAYRRTGWHGIVAGVATTPWRPAEGLAGTGRGQATANGPYLTRG
jgi:hypothetical protein